MDVRQHNGDVAEISMKLDECLSVDSDDQMEAYHRLIQDGKDVGRQGDMKKALKFFKLANDIRQSEKLESRIKKIEEHLSQDESEEEDDDFVDVNGSGLMLFKELYDKLYDYQRNGVAFLYGLHRDGRKGGILADDMGLGKTIQVISFLSGMYDSELAKHTLLVMPTSLITNWTKEFAKWTPGMRVKEFHGTGKERTRNLEKVQRRSGVVITTYTMVMNNWQQLSSYNGGEFTWDYVILDEAHKIKNTSTKSAKSVYAIPSKNRVLLTGTPVQNNLKEMWALFDFACHGTLLGTARTFKTEYENPITRAREKDATPGEKALGSRMSENLMTIIQPYFLRRTKAEVQKDKINREQQEGKDGRVPKPQKDSGAVMPTLKRKNDLIVWTYLSAVQEDIYRQFISLDHIKELLMTTRSPLAELNIMKKLCDHPRLFSAAAIAKLGLEESRADGQQNGNVEVDPGSIANIPDDTLISESGKLVFLFALLERLRDEGHRTLVFAHYRKVLDIIERILGNRGFKVMRLDGTITQIAERERLITRFQADRSYSVFLLTTQVGGVGITLTAADRVVIYDPSWNPATDAQAVDRAYRIGQTENVVIYRLITCGTVEEKIYRRQVFKDSLIRQSTGDKKNPFRYFSRQDLKELFILEDTRSSSTQLQLQELHSRHRRTDPELDEHIAHLHTMEMFGISDHDLMFSVDVNHDEAPEDQEAHHYIEGRVQKAQELMKAESELQMQLADSMASSTEPAWLRQPESNNNWEQSHKKKNPRPSPSFPQPDRKFNGSPIVVELDQSGSDKEGVQQNGTPVIDLTVDESMSEEQPVVLEGSRDELPEQNLYSPKHPSVERERSSIEEEEDATPQVNEDSLVVSETSNAAAGDTADVSVQDLMDQSATSEPYVTAGDEPPEPLQNKRLSVLKLDLDPKTDASSRVSSGLESFEGNFNLQLEESDFSDREVLDHRETEEEERKLLSQLQMEGTFDVYKSLSESQHKEKLSLSHASEMDQSMDDSIVAIKKKRAAVIYDSEDEDEDDGGQHNHSFEVLGASTPKSGPAPLRSRKSVGGNTSVASRRSFIMSMIEDTDMADEDDVEVSGRHPDEEEVIGSTRDELQLEETVGETLNSEEEEEESGQEVSNNMEEEESEQEVSNDMESGQEVSNTMEEFGQEVSNKVEEEESGQEVSNTMEEEEEESGQEVSNKVEEESFVSLVRRGKERSGEGKLDEALNLFLRAIDMKPGDPEVQLMTIQLYRQLSQRS
ncbi:DNA excision repair protein ERCC-6-like [Cebidichthys violaceus]|uniref:DNA excision repair protein ERCC-6-like n=1 Tax=Cebidichthys violaceus TaxID=271503 RepID=UPI0035CA5FE6